MKGKLNLFQATMLRWRELHPYSAVHVVRVAQPLDAARLERAIDEHLEQLGLTGLRVDRHRRRYEWAGGPAATHIRVLPGGREPLAVVCREIERELNIAFAANGRVDPFRFFAVDDGPSFHLGVAYDHFVGAGDSMVSLLRGFVGRYADEPAPAASAPLRLYAPTYARLFRRQLWPFLKGLTSLPGLARNCRRSFRPRYAAPDDGYNAFVHFRVNPPEHAALTRIATAWDATPQDLMLAILLKALSPLAPQRWRAPKRNELAVASIVNVRRDLGAEAENAFAPYLASFRVSHPVPDDMGLRDLVAAVSAQTNRIKRGKLYLQTLLALGVSGFEWRFLSAKRRQRFFAKHYPLCAGITPLSVSPLWPTVRGDATPIEYLRAVSTGPLAPMIVALTTTGDVVHAGVSFRTTVFGREAVDGIAAAMLRSIRTLWR